MEDSGNAILAWKGHYERNLTLARLGILPFFWLSCLLIWRFMSSQFGPWNAAAAVFLFAFCPVVLGHSELATTDAPLMAMFLWSTIGLWELLQAPTWPGSVKTGLIIGLCLLTKFTAIPFLLLTGGVLWAYTWAKKKRFPIPWKITGLAVLVLSLTVWAGYRFEVGPVRDPGVASASQNQVVQTPLLRSERAFASWPGVPANRFFRQRP